MKRAKTNLYSRLWYVRRNRKKLYVYIFPLTMLIVLIMLFLYFENVIKPSFLEFSDYKIKAIINNSVAKAVNDNFPEEINYEEIVKINKDDLEKIKSIQVDVGKLNRTFSKVTLNIQEELDALGDVEIGVPIGVLTGKSVFSARGPRINIKVIPEGSVETDFRSEFTSAGINQTKHRIYFLVKTKVGIAVPFINKTTEVTTSIPIAETVIVGDVPWYYLNFENIEN
ncbi:sporulation protein YunB [Acetivibrio saccincola]|mgnify:FL=1|uniref:Sporulation protein YunB n=1 Tax=Acetivibrio saccincola TaxID=1677857 RepID=A0A2K9E9C0_9FIRM|nr:sporulation protein YunB [Acetivibrio saccincola]AUG56614.1 Sporulation protein YunB [Acetivibrio saccincola]HQD28156.1 sporulation protein YunB [Acetivibrio saccincola]